MELKVKKMKDDAIIPTRGSEEAAGVDLYACIPDTIELFPGQTTMIPTGIACDFPEGYFGLVAIRSGNGVKRGLRLANQVGIIDADYKGEIMLGIYNGSNIVQFISPNERLAQLILLPYVTYNIVETDTLSDTERGEGGFGSTGK